MVWCVPWDDGVGGEVEGGGRGRPRWETRWKSDLDCTARDEDEDGEGEDEEESNVVDAVGAVLNGLIGMETDVDAMQRFSKSMSQEGPRFVTMDDVTDETRQDEEGGGGHETFPVVFPA